MHGWKNRYLNVKLMYNIDMYKYEYSFTFIYKNSIYNLCRGYSYVINLKLYCGRCVVILGSAKFNKQKHTCNHIRRPDSHHKAMYITVSKWGCSHYAFRHQCNWKFWGPFIRNAFYNTETKFTFQKIFL